MARVSPLLVATLLAASSPPGSAGWPARPAEWTTFRCDFSGVRVPSIARFGKTDNSFSIIYPLYPPEVRAEIRAAHKARGYTHFVLDPAPKYKDLYPRADLYGQPEVMKAAMRELLDDGLLPVVMFDPGGEHGWTPEHAAAEMRRKLEPWFADRELLSMIQVANVGWEIDDHLSPEAIEAVARYLRSALPPETRLFVHLSPGKKSAARQGETDAQWWTRMARDNVLDGLFFNYPAGDHPVRDFTDALTGMSEAFSGKVPGWPSRRADGRPLILVAFEYSAFFDYKRPEWNEDWARSLGGAAMQVPGVAGFCDGGPGRW